MRDKINTIVPAIVMVIVLGVRWHAVTGYSIDAIEDMGLCAAATAALLLSLFNLAKLSNRSTN